MSATTALRADREVVKEALSRDGGMLAHVSDDAIRSDRDLVLLAAAHAGWVAGNPTPYKGVLETAAPALRADKAVVLAAVAKYAEEFPHADVSLRVGDRDVVMAAVASGASLVHVPEGSALLEDRDLISAAVRIAGSNLRYAAPALRDDRDIVLLAVKSDGLAAAHASERLRADPEIKALYNETVADYERAYR